MLHYFFLAYLHVADCVCLCVLLVWSAHSTRRESSGRLCREIQLRKEHPTADVTAVSTEKLLEASLNSLESMSRQVNVNVTSSLDVTASNNNMGVDTSHHAESGGYYPSDAYLRGALWLGRNLTMVCEDLADEMETQRTKYLSEIATAAQDGDSRRALHRMSLLASSSVSDAVALTSKGRTRARNILEVSRW